MLVAISAMVGRSCSRSRILVKGLGANNFNSPLLKLLQLVGRMNVSKVGLESLSFNPCRTLVQSSSPVSTKIAALLEFESTHVVRLRHS